jgi:hypothetical protein
MNSKPKAPSENMEGFIHNSKDEQMYKTIINPGTSTQPNIETIPDASIGTTPEASISASTNTSTNVGTKTILSTNLDTNEIIIEKRLKYSEERVHRAYYIKRDTIKKLEQISKRYNIDKSDIVDQALKLFLNNIDKE